MLYPTELPGRRRRVYALTVGRQNRTPERTAAGGNNAAGRCACDVRPGAAHVA